MRPLFLAGFLLLAGTTFGHAEDEFEDGQDQWDSQIVLAAETERARSAGGYSNPFSALMSLFGDNARDDDVQESLTDVTQIPETFLE
ncbi:MAG: hypothetical protein AAF479_13835 [Pseudomonadota bacterium]